MSRKQLRAPSVSIAVSLCSGVLAVSGVASASLLNVDFNGAIHNGSGPTAQGLGPATNDGIGSANDVWNGENDGSTSSGTDSNLHYADNTPATGVTLTWSADTSWNISGATNSPNAALTQDFLFNGGAGGTVTLSGLPTGQSYSLYVVAINDQDGGNRPTAVTLTEGASTSGSTQASAGNYGNNGVPTGVWTKNQQYVLFSGVTPDTNGNIQFTFAGNGGDNIGTVNGLQLVSVPEPASLSLLGFSSLALIARRRRA